MRASILAAVGFAAITAMSATAAAAATVISIGGGTFGVSPPPANVSAFDTVVMTGSLEGASATSAFVINALTDLRFVEFEISTSGSIANMNLISIDLDNGGGTKSFIPVDLGGGFGFGGTNYAPFNMRAGDTVTLTFTDTSFVPGTPPTSGLDGGLGFTLFGDTVSAVVPVPAGLPLLLTALGGMAILRARRKATV